MGTRFGQDRPVLALLVVFFSLFAFSASGQQAQADIPGSTKSGVSSLKDVEEHGRERLSPPEPAQDGSPPPANAFTPTMLARHGKSFFREIGAGEKAIWTSPFRLRAGDAQWLAPLAGGLALLMATDARAARGLPNTEDQVKFSRRVSLLGSDNADFAIAGGFYLAGALARDERARETGIQATQALIHSQLVMTGLKLAMGRQRPTAGDGNGRFWHYGSDSFPSGHALASWSLASVIAHQYADRKWVPFAAYGAATAVGLSRIGARKHFPSDVLAGSAIGWMIGRYVHRVRAGSSGATSRLVPRIAPHFDARSGGAGLSLMWE